MNLKENVMKIKRILSPRPLLMLTKQQILKEHLKNLQNSKEFVLIWELRKKQISLELICSHLKQ